MFSRYSIIFIMLRRNFRNGRMCRVSTLLTA